LDNNDGSTWACWDGELYVGLPRLIGEAECGRVLEVWKCLDVPNIELEWEQSPDAPEGCGWCNHATDTPGCPPKAE
jgi:hypothetical protein